MKKILKWLGISTLLVSFAVLPTIVSGETNTSNEEPSTSNSITSEPVSTEQLDSTLESKIQTTETSTESSNENNNTIDTALTISNLSYDFSTKTISGKTTPNATVYATIVYDSNGVAEPSASSKADSTGTFSINHLFNTGEKINLIAQLDGAIGEPATFIIPDDPSLIILNLSYDFSTKTLSGRTAPNADVYAILSSNKSSRADALTKADKNGDFLFVGQFSPGQEIKFIAYLNGACGSELTFTIPTKAPTLTLNDLFYDHDTGTFSGKTAPHAAVGLTIPATMGQVRVMSDENGDFSYKETLAPGTVLSITAYLGEDYSDTVLFTVPEKNASSDSSISSKPFSKTKNTLPNTGESRSFTLSALGLLIVLATPIISKKIV